MIIIMKPNASEEAVKKVTDLIESKGLTPHLSQGSQVTIVGVVGDKSRLAGSNIEISEGVDKVVSVTESYKLVNKKFHPDDSVVPVGNTHIGPGNLDRYGRPLRHRVQRTADGNCICRKKGRGYLPAGRRLQAAHLPLLLPGLRGRRFKIYERSQRGYRLKCHLRGHKRPCYRSGFQICRYAPDRSQKYAEL